MQGFRVRGTGSRTSHTTIMFHNHLVPSELIVDWLSRQTTVLSPGEKILMYWGFAQGIDIHGALHPDPSTTIRFYWPSSFVVAEELE